MHTDDLFPDDLTDPGPEWPITTEDDAADLVDSVVDLDDIVRGSLLFYLCDARRLPLAPVMICDVPLTAPPGETLEHWLGHVSQVCDGETPTLVFARARPGQSFVLDHDREWHQAAVHACAATGIPLLHSFVITQHAVVPLPRPVVAGNVPPPPNHPMTG